MTEAQPPVWQFSLRELFGLTTYAACVIALTKSWGPGTLILGAGWLLAWMNFCGRFRIIQAGNGRRLAILVAWCGFVGSMFCPAIRFFNTDIRGWELAVQVLLWVIPSSLPFSEPELQWAKYLIALPGIVFIDAANISGVLALLSLRWPHGTFQRCIGIVLHVALVSVWALTTFDPNPYVAGYYLWVASLTLLACTFRIDQRTAVTMLVGTSIVGLSPIVNYFMQTAS